MTVDSLRQSLAVGNCSDNNVELVGDIKADKEPQWNFAAAVRALCNAQDGDVTDGCDGTRRGSAKDPAAPSTAPRRKRASDAAEAATSPATTSDDGEHKKRKAAVRKRKSTYIVQKVQPARDLMSEPVCPTSSIIVR